MEVNCFICNAVLNLKPSKVCVTSSCVRCRSLAKSIISSKGHTKTYNAYIERWKSGLEGGMRGVTSISSHIRRYLLERSGSKCEQCGWSKIHPVTGKVPLEINHKDGDHTNNKEDNLEIICPNCHSLTETYRSLNKGKGRPR